jgi:hypothetical protein
LNYSGVTKLNISYLNIMYRVAKNMHLSLNYNK